MDVFDKIIAFQKRNKSSDVKIAGLIGITTQYWQQIRTDPDKRKRVVSPVLSGIINGFPQFEKDVINFIKNNNKG